MCLTDADRVELIRLEKAMWRSETRFDPRSFSRRHFAAGFMECGRRLSLGAMRDQRCALRPAALKLPKPAVMAFWVLGYCGVTRWSNLLAEILSGSGGCMEKRRPALAFRP